MNVKGTQRSRLVSTGLSLLSILSLTAAALMLAAPALANHNVAGPAVTPVLIPGNPDCASLGSYVEVVFGTGEINSGQTKTATVGGETATVTILSTDGMSFSFDIDNAEAAHVLAKGGNNANDYNYTARPSGGIGHDDGLVAPLNGGANQPQISHINFCLIPEAAATTPPSQSASPSPSGSPSQSASPTVAPTPTPGQGGGAALNIRKVDENGRRLAGAVFTIDGMAGTFTTGADGQVCITGLPDDSEWLVTEIQAPAGYEIADPASQMVEVDDDGDCNSPDARFVNVLAQPTETASPTPSESEAPGTPTPTPSESEAPSTPTPSEGELGGNPTPTPGGGQLPDTASAAVGQVPVTIAGLLGIASLAALLSVRLAEARRRS